jgi:hypothetical protein
MTTYIARFGGYVVAFLAIVVGVLIGRIIEAVAVAIVLWAIWGYLARLVAPDRDASHRGGGEVS